MTLALGPLHTSSGARLEPGELLGRGGEARVHAVRGDEDLAVKLYARPDAERARKLAAMIARAPLDPDRRSGHVSIAWPSELVLDDDGRVAGFVMPRIDAGRYLPLHQLYHPRSRRSRAPGINWRYLVRIARNLSAALAALHDADYVVGDLNESNVLVDDRALVTLVDLDSIQVRSGFRTFRCNVGKAEYTPPELQGRSFRETDRKPSSDRFGLAVLVFLLLMEGNHPFAGTFRGEGEPPGLEANIRTRRSPYFGRSLLKPPPAAPPIELLSPELRGLLRKALLGQPRRRPGAATLKEALADLEQDLLECSVSGAHSYSGHLDTCPWCQRAALLGSDPYPSSAKVAASGVSRTGPKRGSPTGRPRAAAGFRGSWPQFLMRLPLLSLFLLILLAAPAFLWQAEILTVLGFVAPIAAARYAALGLVATLPALTLSAGLYRRARRRPEFARALFRLERVVRGAVAAGLLSLLASLAAGLLLGRGSVLTGDWLLLPSFWVVAFVVSLRFVGPRLS